MITAVNSTKSSYTPSFNANIPNTVGKKACDRMAKQLLEYGNVEEQNFAQRYFKSIKKIKKEKDIDEVILCSTNKTRSMPYISADGYRVNSFNLSKQPENLNKSEQKTFMLMDCVNYLADTIQNVIIGIKAM